MLSSCGSTSLDADGSGAGSCVTATRDASGCSDAGRGDATALDGNGDTGGADGRAGTGGADGSGQAGDGGNAQAAMVTSYLVNPAHTNAVSDPTLVPPFGLLWSMPLAGGGLGFPLIAGGRIYLTIGGSPPQLEALDESTGNILWGPIGLSGYNMASQAYDAGRVFTYTGDGTVDAFDAATGARVWSGQVAAPFGNPDAPTAYGGLVYVPTPGSLIALDEATGNQVWSATLDGPSVSSPAVTEDGVFASAGCGGMYAFNRTTGALLWNTGPACDGGGSDAPAVFGGRVYVQLDPTVAPVVLDAHTGAMLGSFCSVTSPAFDGTRGFCDLRTDLEAIDLTSGSTAWTYGAGLSVNMDPFVAAGTVFVSSDSGKLYEVDEQTGAMVWSTQVDPLGTGAVVGGEGILLAQLYTGGLAAYRHVDVPDAGVVIGDGGPATPIVLASGQSSTSLALSSTRVYWTDYAAGQVRSVDKSGGQPVTVDDAPGTYPWGITVDATNVYWTVPNFVTGGMNPTIMSIPIAGGAATTLAASAGGPTAIVVSPTTAYWANDNAIDIQSVALDGGPVANVASGSQAGIGLAIDATNLYWSTSAGIFVQPLAGGTTRNLASAGADALAVDATNVYYVAATSNGAGVVAFVPIAGGAPTTLTSGRTASLVAVAVDDRNVYWIEGNGTIGQAALAAVPKSGGMVSVLASGMSSPSALAVDDSGIYFNDRAAGDIEKIAK